MKLSCLSSVFIAAGAALTLSVLLRSASLRSTFYPFLGTIIHALPIDPFGIQSSLSDLSSVSIDQTNRSSSVSVASLKVNHDTKTRSQDSAVVMAGMRALGTGNFHAKL